MQERGRRMAAVPCPFTVCLAEPALAHFLFRLHAGHLAEESKNRDLMAKQENALQQLILMALNDNGIVVAQICQTLGRLGWGWGRWLDLSLIPSLFLICAHHGFQEQ